MNENALLNVCSRNCLITIHSTLWICVSYSFSVYSLCTAFVFERIAFCGPDLSWRRPFPSLSSPSPAPLHILSLLRHHSASSLSLLSKFSPLSLLRTPGLLFSFAPVSILVFLFHIFVLRWQHSTSFFVGSFPPPVSFIFHPFHLPFMILFFAPLPFTSKVHVRHARVEKTIEQVFYVHRTYIIVNFLFNKSTKKSNES